jgi:uncharacterized membrane protein
MISLKKYKNILIYAALAVIVPVLLCSALSLLGDSEDLGSGLRIFFYGLLLIILICPLYLMGLNLYFTVKKGIKFITCILFCVIVTIIINIQAIFALGLADIEGIVAVMYVFTFSVFSAAAMAGSMAVVHAVNRRIRERLEEEGESDAD